MPTVNLYNIVTNDEYELPVVMDIKGAEKVGEILGIPANMVRKRIWRGKWPKKCTKKAIVVGVVEYEDRPTREKRYRMKEDRTEYFRQRYRRKQNTKQTQEG